MQNFDRVYQAYLLERRLGATFSKKAFEILLRCFPAILIAQADGFTDTTEMGMLEEVVKFLCQKENFAHEDVDWRMEIRYLGIDGGYWRERFLTVLSELLATKPELYHEQAEFLTAVATCSTGDLVKNMLVRLGRADLLSNEEIQFVSQAEKDEILRITERLGFPQHPEAQAYLKKLLPML
ncbi:MAG: hypothetical protein ACUVRD_06010 [Bacteroidia bacterium]